jgi:hypothetical protein
MIKVGQGITALNLFLCSFNEDIIFPFYKRATSTAVCNFVSRTCQIMAPLVAELERPIPVWVLISIYIIATFAAIFLPSYNDELEFEK